MCGPENKGHTNRERFFFFLLLVVIKFTILKCIKICGLTHVIYSYTMIKKIIYIECIDYDVEFIYIYTYAPSID